MQALRDRPRMHQREGPAVTMRMDWRVKECTMHFHDLGWYRKSKFSQHWSPFSTLGNIVDVIGWTVVKIRLKVLAFGVWPHQTTRELLHCVCSGPGLAACLPVCVLTGQINWWGNARIEQCMSVEKRLRGFMDTFSCESVFNSLSRP